ncbi:hypothetical protein Tco_0243618, partial [Tanacetum coccineum]
DFSDCEDSRARSFHQEFHILSFISGIQYPFQNIKDDVVGKIDCNRLNTGSITVKSGSNS